MVELKRGDRVKFLNDTGSGTVTRIIDREMVMVRTDDGFEYPVLGSELLKGGSDDLRSVVVGSDGGNKTGDTGSNTGFTGGGETDIQDGSDRQTVSGSKGGSRNSLESYAGQGGRSGNSSDQVTGGEFSFKGFGSADVAAVPDKEPDIYIAVVPFDYDEPVGGEVSLFIINDSDWSLLYHCAVIEHGKIRHTVSAGVIEPGIKINCGDYHIDDLFGSARNVASGGVEVTIVAWGEVIKGRAVIFRQLVKPGRDLLATRSAYRENDFFDEDAFLLKVEKEGEPVKEGRGDRGGRTENRERNPGVVSNQDYPDSEASLKIAGDSGVVGREKGSGEKREKGKLPREIDLHIGEIVDNSNEMTPGEIINIQLARFRTSLEGALISKERSVVYIHGTGAGKLKHEIRRIIDREYQACTYQDASFREYGYGATLVIIKNRR
ncbi:MAG: DUF2027 domain-containing protein [Bacteroidales bacterium]|nr:DUF2027 domain-containing protein [Bacteroidales bacterium]